jgi:hypothetical protein
VLTARGGFRCGTPGAVAGPGLLTGLAGLGHGLLRLARPDRVPAVLLLRPPLAEQPAAVDRPLGRRSLT